MHPNTKFCLVWGFTALAAAGAIYGFNEAMNQAAEEVKRDQLAKHQEREAYKAANPDFGPGGINMRISREIAEKGVLSRYVCRDTNIDTLTTPNVGQKHRPAPMIGSRAGFTHVDFQDTLIADKSKEKGVQISIPKRIPNRYKDSSGR